MIQFKCWVDSITFIQFIPSFELRSTFTLISTIYRKFERFFWDAQWINSWDARVKHFWMHSITTSYFSLWIFLSVYKNTHITSLLFRRVIFFKLIIIIYLFIARTSKTRRIILKMQDRREVKEVDFLGRRTSFIQREEREDTSGYRASGVVR